MRGNIFLGHLMYLLRDFFKQEAKDQVTSTTGEVHCQEVYSTTKDLHRNY